MGKFIRGVVVGLGVMLVAVGFAAVGHQRVPLSSSCLRGAMCRGARSEKVTGGRRRLLVPRWLQMFPGVASALCNS